MTWNRTNRHPRIRGHALQRRRERLLRAEPLCRLCAAKGRVSAAVQLDHIIALANGGPDTEENLQPICRECHATKSALDLGHMQHGGCDIHGNPSVPWPKRK